MSGNVNDLELGRERVGQEVRTNHRYGFRCGEWAKIVDWSDDADGPCWLVRFADGETDWWRVDDEAGQYEFRIAPFDPREDRIVVE